MTKFRSVMVHAFFGILLSVIAACSPVTSSVQSVATPTAMGSTTASPQVTAAPSVASTSSITVTDGAKRVVTIKGSPQRIVSLAPSTTEIAFALGLGDRVVAVESYSDFPPEAKNLPKIKSFPINIEQVVSFKPDLVLAAGITGADDVKRLADLNLTVLVVGTENTTFQNVMTDIQLVGNATGTEDKAKQVTQVMQQKLDALKATLANATSKPKVYWELDATDPAKPFTPGPGSFVNDIISLSGGINVAGNAKLPYSQISAEELVSANPDIIILSDVAYGITLESVKARQGWSSINAVKNNRVYPIDDNLVSRPGPRLVDGLEAAAKLIHPELFH